MKKYTKDNVIGLKIFSQSKNTYIIREGTVDYKFSLENTNHLGNIMRKNQVTLNDIDNFIENGSWKVVENSSTNLYEIY